MPRATTLGAPGAGELLDLQRTAGNAAAVAMVQRVSRAGEIPVPITDVAAAGQKLNTLSMTDLIDTLDDLRQRGASGALLADPAALSPLGPVRRDRILATARAVASMIDPQFYIAWSHLDPVDQGPLLARAEKSVKGAGTAEHRIAVMGGGLIGMIRANAYGEAFAFLNGLNMAEILTTATSARGAAQLPTGAAPARGTATTMLDDLVAHLGEARGVNVTRIQVALEAVTSTVDFTAFAAAHPAVNGPDLQPFERDDLRAFLARGGVADFTATVANADLHVEGQFFWSAQLINGLMTDPDVAALNTRASPPDHLALFVSFQTLLQTAADRDQPTSTVAAQARAFTAAVHAAHPPGAAHLIALASIVAAAPIAAQVDPGPFAKKSVEFRAGWAIYQTLNGGFTVAPDPDVSKQKNVSRLHYLAQAEAEVCGFQASFLASRFRALANRAGRPAPDPAVRVGGLALATGVVAQHRPVKQGGIDVLRGDVCTYGSGLAGAVARIRAALDGGWIVTVRVMSGFGGGGLRGEHSFALIGHQGNAFTVADSDPGNEGDPRFKTGFTTVYFDPAVPRLSTAVNDAEFPGLAAEPHLQINRHHRYQVLSVTGCV